MTRSESLKWRTEKRKVSELKLFEGNPRKMTEKQAQDLLNSLQKFNLVEIPAIDQHNRVIAGNMRIQALQRLGRSDEEIEVRVPNKPLTEKEAREYLLRSNKNVGSWDYSELANFDEELLLDVGFDEKEIENIESYAPELQMDTDIELSDRELRSPINYIGGKYYLAPWICSFLNYDCTIYVEVFGGAGHVLFAKKPHKVEIYNDINSDIVNFFLVLQRDEKKLFNTLDRLPYSRKIFDLFKEKKPKSDFEKAVRWFYIIRNSFSGNQHSWARGFKHSLANVYYSSLQLFSAVHERIKNVQFEYQDYRQLLKSIQKKPAQNQKDIMLYCDPPYYNAEDYYPGEHFKTEDHKILAQILNSLKCKIAVSYYPHDKIKKLYPESRWKYHYRQATKYSQNKTGESKSRATEMLITNY